ncbi:hypothetical protein BDR07DRAFT_1512025, partial [Suillus spraguei]
AVELHGYIQWNNLCPNYGALSSAKVLLDAGKMSGRVTQGGNFSILDVPPGTYVLSVLSRDYSFDHVRIDVSPSEPLPKSDRTYSALLSSRQPHLAFPIHCTDPPSQEQVLFASRILQSRGDVPESDDDDYGIDWRVDACNALYHKTIGSRNTRRTERTTREGCEYREIYPEW